MIPRATARCTQNVAVVAVVVVSSVCADATRCSESSRGTEPRPQQTTVNLLAACVFVLDKVHQHQQQQQLLLKKIMAVVGIKKTNIFYGTHKHGELARRVVVHAAIPAASNPLLGAHSALQRHRHSPASSSLVLLSRALTLSQQQPSPSSEEAETGRPKRHNEIDRCCCCTRRTLVQESSKKGESPQGIRDHLIASPAPHRRLA